MPRPSRTGSILKRHSQTRRRAAKQDKNPSDKTTSDGSFTFNFTADFKEKLSFSQPSKQDQSSDTDLQIQEENNETITDKDTTANENSQTNEEAKPFPCSRTIVAAVARKDLDLLEELLSREESDNATPGLSNTAELNHGLMLAITNKQTDAVQRLLSAGADVHYFDHMYPMLLLAVDIRAPEVFELVIKHIKSCDVNSMYGNLIHAAARAGDSQVLKRVIDLGVDINAKAKSSEATPLHDAVRSVKFIGKKKTPSWFSVENSSAIKWNSELPDCNSKKRNHQDMDTCETTEPTNTDIKETNDDIDDSGYDLRCLDYLIEKGCDLNAQDATGKTALHEAAIMGNIATAKRLIEAGASISVTDNKHHTPMMYAMMHNHFVELVSLLTNESILHKPVTSEGKYYIHLACDARNVKVLRYLISRDCDVNVIYDDMTPLMYAIKGGHFPCAKLLLEETNCDVTFEKSTGNSALSILLSNENQFNSCSALLPLLISRGVDIDQQTSAGVTPLMRQIHSSHKGWVRILLENGADVNLMTKNGEYALLLACDDDDEEMVKLLLQYNANMNLTSRVFWQSSDGLNSNCVGVTPLQVALRRQQPEMVKLLLAAGCSTKGVTAWLNGDGLEIKQHFINEHNNLITYIEHAQDGPISLLDLARCQIRARTGVTDKAKYEKLPLPTLIKKYLDIDTCLTESIEFLDSFRDS